MNSIETSNQISQEQLNKTLANKLVVVTGAGRGIGLELTRQALVAGARVVAGLRRPKSSAPLLELEKAYEGRLFIFELDVSSDESVRQFAESITHATGSGAVDVLFNNAGIYLDGDNTAENVQIEALTKTLDVNAIGSLRVTQSLIPMLRRARDARVANITSQMGSIADNSSGGALAYRMSKAALNMFSKTLARDEGEMVVLSLHPGWVKTEMGGPRATTDATQSAEGLLKLTMTATKADSGKFFTYSGKSLPW